VAVHSCRYHTEDVCVRLLTPKISRLKDIIFPAYQTTNTPHSIAVTTQYYTYTDSLVPYRFNPMLKGWYLFDTPDEV
jgi:hypothetical protein